MNECKTYKNVKIKEIIKLNPKSKFPASHGAENGKYMFFKSDSGKETLFSDDKIISGENIIMNDGGNCNFKYYDGECAYSDHCISFSATDEVSTRFLFFLLKTLETKINTNGFIGGGLKNIDRKYFYNLEVKIPSREKQDKIVAALAPVEESISAAYLYKEKLEEEKRGIMQKIFSQEIRFKDDDGNDYPKWEEKMLSNICDVRDGTHDSPQYIEKGYPFITSKNFTENGTIDMTDVNYISEKDYNAINTRSKVDIGDILFGMIGTIGKPVLVKNNGFAIKNVALIKPIDINNQYLYQYIQSNHIKNQFLAEQKGGTQKFIALGTIRQLKIKVPKNIEEQRKIADFLSTFDAAIETQNKIIENLESLQKGLMQKLF